MLSSSISKGFYKGVKKSGFGIITSAIALASILSLVSGFTGEVVKGGDIAFTGAFAGIIAGVMAFAGVTVGVIAIAIAFALAGVIAFALAGIIAFTFAIALAGIISSFIASPVAEIVAHPLVVTLTLLASFIAYRAMKGDPRDAWIKNFVVAFAASGGTTFRKANLTDANLSQTRLKSTDFREAILTRTCFKKAEKLDRIRPGKTILSQPHVRELLTTGYGYKKSYFDANLQGANLDGANLNQANLKQCNLNDASLRATNLEGANLSQVSAINTNFTRCNLTGACIEAWNIDKTTILDKVDCLFLFLLEKENQDGHRERRPYDPNKMFQPGDFKKLYQEIINTVQLLVKNGIKPEAFKTAFDKIVEENPNIGYDNIQGFERKGNDVLVTVEVPEDADKGEIENTFDKFYELQLKEENTRNLLAAEKEHKKDIMKIIKSFTDSPTYITNNSNTVNNSSDNSKNITTGDMNATNSIINLGEIKGKVSNNIKQLPDNTEDGQISIKELLSQLKIAIETEDNINDETKTEVLDSVKNITESAKNPEDSNLKKMAKLSKNAILGIVSTLPTATKLVTECNELLPAISELLGL